jgi:spermidine/putrescine transport system permease protein
LPPVFASFPEVRNIRVAEVFRVEASDAITTWLKWSGFKCFGVVCAISRPASHLWTAFAPIIMNRRSAIASLSVVVAALLAGGCAKKSTELNLYGWAEYIPQEVIDGFTKQTGIKVTYETFDDLGAMAENIAKPGSKYDLIQPSEYVIEELVAAKLLSPIDHGKIPNIKNLGSEFIGLPFDKTNTYTLPYLAGSIGIIVDREKIKDPIKSFSDVFSGKYAGRIVAIDDSRELLAAYLVSNGKGLNEITPDNIAGAKDEFGKWLKQVAVFDSDSPKDAIREGKADIGIIWSGEAAILCGEDRKYQYILPKTGAHRFVDNMAIPANAPHKDAAHEFINYCLRPDVSVLISNAFPYTNPNVEARKLLKSDQLNNPASYPAGANLLTFSSIGKLQEQVDELFASLKPEEVGEKTESAPAVAESSSAEGTK